MTHGLLCGFSVAPPEDGFTQGIVLRSYGPPTPIPIWDEWPFDDGVLFVVTNEYGPIGAVRAKTWESAYECAVDEIALDACEDSETDDPDGETWSYRGSGAPSNGDTFPGRNSHLADTEHLKLFPATDPRFGVLVR